MKNLVAGIFAVIVTLLTCSTISTAQSDGIFLFGDSLRTSCTDTVYREYSAFFYMYHHAPSGAQGSRFLIPRDPCILSDNIVGPYVYTPHPKTGTLETGIEFNYGQCRSGWIYVGVISYWDIIGLDGMPFCCEQLILPHPSAATGMVESIDCAGEAQTAAIHTGIFNGNSTCPCPVVTGITDRPITWGAIKALYR
jgi:hypothetical protein